jgi:hypothetical protein
MAVQRHWALPFSVDPQDPQLLAVTGHVGGAKGVHIQTLRWRRTVGCGLESHHSLLQRGGKKIESHVFIR